jgi:hypothetical protein
VPSVFRFVGRTDPDRYAKAKVAGRLNEIPTNHNPDFSLERNQKFVDSPLNHRSLPGSVAATRPENVAYVK